MNTGARIILGLILLIAAAFIITVGYITNFLLLNIAAGIVLGLIGIQLIRGKLK